MRRVSKHRLLPITLLLACAGAAQGAGRIDVTAEGADAPLGGALQAEAERYTAACDADRWRIRRELKRAIKNVDATLRAFGHYRARVDETLDFEDDCWQAELEIDLGPRVAISRRRIEITGPANDDSAFAALLADLPLSQGAHLRHDQYESIKQRLNSLALERGYLDFTLTRSELRVDPEAGTADITIEARSGVRYRINEVRISEQPLDEAFLRRLINLTPGTPYKSSAVTAIDRRLSASGYFNEVDVRPRRDQRLDGELPLEIKLSPAPRHAWRFGLGFATDLGPRASARYDNRYLNREGHRLETDLRLSPVESGLTADYLIPGRQPNLETFSLGIGYLYKDTDSVESDSVAAIGRHIIKSKPWFQTRYVEWQYESATVANDDSDTTLLMPGIAIERLEADDPLRTQSGFRINLSVRAASDALFSSASFIQLRGSAKGIQRLGDAGRISARIDAGTTPGDSVDDLPASIRFFAGGDRSIRGYEYESLGPQDADGNTTGGRHLLTGGLEYEHPVFGDDTWIAAFVDAGNAFTDDLDVRYGVGIGVRWYSPVGRVRLDLAFPDDTRDDDWRIHFGLGADL